MVEEENSKYKEEYLDESLDDSYFERDTRMIKSMQFRKASAGLATKLAFSEKYNDCQ